ncbi:hypothetical protein TNCV_860231 [Trichonephila clavipes]|nr:hypothetical protein TNCV_860231 [Trichonephila clavipes]
MRVKFADAPSPPPLSMEGKFGEEVPAQVTSSSLDHDSKLRAKNWFCLVLHENGEASCRVGEGVMVYSRGQQPMALGTILSGTLHYSTNLLIFE